ncbi:MAG: RHS repeat-associated core domain-containing protein, partial [Polyangia bacterium]|jgi:RHS repeat-associated protein|nr:RHS repeat-associated core domain-containing protein [Polyangia bacterium]
VLTLGTDVPQHIGRVRYDDAGRVTELVYPAPEGEEPMVVRREYNRRGLLRRIYGPDPLATLAQPGDPRPNYDYLVIDDPTGGPSDPRGYNEKGQRCGYRHGDASEITHLRTYDLNGRLRKASSKQTVSIAGRTPYDLFYKKYSYDGASNITRIEDLRDWNHVNEYTGGKNLPYDLVIAHDALDRVTQVSYERKPEELVSLPPGAPSARRVMRYAYSAVGNLLERSTTNGDGVENPEDEFYEKWLGSDIQAHPARPHAFGSAADPAAPDGTREVGATYDANGNMKTLVVINVAMGRNDRFVYHWDQYDRLVAVEKWNDSLSPSPEPGGGSGSPIAEAYYLYDSGGQRVAKHELTSDDTTGTGQDTLYVTEGLDLRNHHYERYVFDGSQRISRIGVARPYDATAPPPPAPPLSSLTRLVLVSDHLGSTSTVLMDHDDAVSTPTADDRGCTVSTRSHLPYGGDEAESSVEQGCGQPIEEQYRFTGKEVERELGILYFGSRYYNAQVSRWLSVDPPSIFDPAKDISGHYEYALGSPLRFVDPDGADNLDGLQFRSIHRGLREHGYSREQAWAVTQKIASRQHEALPFYGVYKALEAGDLKLAAKLALFEIGLYVVVRGVVGQVAGRFAPAAKASLPIREVRAPPLSSQVCRTQGHAPNAKVRVSGPKQEVAGDTKGSVDPAPKQGSRATPVPGAARGAAGGVDASAIRFTQDSIGRTFKGEGAATLRETIDGLRSGAISPEGFPAIRVFERDGLTFTLDNRRLFVFQQARVPIRTVPATAEEVAAEAWKFTTRNEGASIRVRGGL